MWQCSECEYFNDDIDQVCAKCGTELTTNAGVPDASGSNSVAAKAAPPMTAAEEKQVPTLDAAKKDQPKAIDRLLLVVVVVVVFAICVVGFIAYSKGNLPWQQPAQGSLSAQTPASTIADLAQPAQFALVEDLEDGLILPRAQAKKLATFTAELEEAWTGLLDKEPTEDQAGQLSVDALAELFSIGEVGNELVFAYQDFETYVTETSSPHLNEAAVLMRGQFNDALSLLVETVSDYRGHDLNGVHETYLLADTVPSVLEGYGWLDGQPFREMWVDARHKARQIELDLKYKEQYLQLAARYDGLEQVHNEFNGVIKQIPPTKVRSGTLGNAAKDYLDALEAYSLVVEGFASEFEEYVATIDELEQSDKLERYIDMNRELAQEDHLFCFMETYKMYAKDKNLFHPVYANLGGHYDWVQETWPKLASNYEGIYRHYEQEWLLFWRPDLLEDRE